VDSDLRPHTTERWEELLDDLDPIRELVVMIERLAVAASADSASTTSYVPKRDLAPPAPPSR